MQKGRMEERLMPPQRQLAQRPRERESSLNYIAWEKMKWAFAGFMIDIASPSFNEIAPEPQVAAKKPLRKLLKKSYFNLLI